jgi:hypothetical protein
MERAGTSCFALGLAHLKNNHVTPNQSVHRQPHVDPVDFFFCSTAFPGCSCCSDCIQFATNPIVSVTSALTGLSPAAIYYGPAQLWIPQRSKAEGGAADRAGALVPANGVTC